jgi:hypothetical protein
MSEKFDIVAKPSKKDADALVAHLRKGGTVNLTLSTKGKKIKFELIGQERT